MDKKGIAIFLGITFAAGYGLEIGLHLMGLIDMGSRSLFHFLMLGGFMCIPGVAALLAAQMAPNAQHPLPGLWPEYADKAIRVGVVTFIAFVVIYAVIGITGVSSPQWDLAVLMNKVPKLTEQSENPAVLKVAPYILLAVSPFLSLVLGLTLFAVVALGSELGWRAYLLPRLMPLGKVPAYTIAGALWTLWLMPLVYLGFQYGARLDAMPLFTVQLLAWAILFGASLAEIMRRTNNVGMAAMALGSFVSQTFGLWGHLFPVTAPPWTGSIGVIALVVWLLLARYPQCYLGKEEIAGIAAPTAKMDSKASI
ncbi:MAG: CPBP family intramembrane metalloprotease [Candidatus Hydrogenedentes bacterium]|nr:CPBP family intramembrane metalloprotease [Candidatus Hydrogenedentota bacterium]